MGRTPMDITTCDEVRSVLQEKLEAEHAEWVQQEAERMATEVIRFIILHTLIV